jgi:GNAT superfamily N-acetyltransferase
MQYEIVTQSSDKLSERELDDFIALVLQGGEVTSAKLEERIRKAERLILLSAAGCLRGIGALKKPHATYRRSVASRSGACLPVSEYPFELGWIFISPSYRRQGLASSIVEAAVSVANGGGIFATSRSENIAMHKPLQTHSFIPTGRPYPSVVETTRSSSLCERRRGKGVSEAKVSATVLDGQAGCGARHGW